MLSSLQYNLNYYHKEFQAAHIILINEYGAKIAHKTMGIPNDTNTQHTPQNGANTPQNVTNAPQNTTNAPQNGTPQNGTAQNVTAQNDTNAPQNVTAETHTPHIRIH
ncbi:MAG: hypothetical protein GY820_34290 [Gammaproteobacteria bacterium]|nr:hypothetical protein [Gammaproteobacteria bacterium]